MKIKRQALITATRQVNPRAADQMELSIIKRFGELTLEDELTPSQARKNIIWHLDTLVSDDSYDYYTRSLANEIVQDVFKILNVSYHLGFEE